MNWELCFFAVAAIFAILFGLFIFRFPEKVFEIQKRFYAMINWRIEPISLSKEIRNTRIMGVFLVLVALAAVLYKALTRTGR